MTGGGGFRSAGSPTQPELDAIAAKQKQAQDAQDAQNLVSFRNETPGSVPGQSYFGQNEFERGAGVGASFRGTTDQNGQLLDQYKIDPFQGAASQALRTEAFSKDPSPWANMATKQQQFEQGQAMGQADQQQQAAESGARANLMRFGGLGGGARTSLARSGARDLLMANQGIGAQGIAARYGIGQQDLLRKQNLMSTNADLERQANLSNIQTLQGNLANRQAFDTNRYNQQMAGWAAKKAAGAM